MKSVFGSVLCLAELLCLSPLPCLVGAGRSLVSLNRLSVGCGTTPRRQSGYLVGFYLFICVIYTMLAPHGHWLILP